MKKISSIILILVMTFLKIFSEAPSLDITYLGNEGFLIYSKNKKVLVDALFSGNSPSFLVPADTMIKQMTEGKSPYDSIDLLLITHNHADHFNPDLIILFLENHSACKLIAHKQVVDKMRGLTDFDKVKSRIVEITLDIGSVSKIVENNIDVDILCTRPNKDVETKNLIFIVSLEGNCFFYCGDAPIQDNTQVLREYSYSKKPIDIMFLQSYDTSYVSKQFITKTIKPDMIIAMHISPDVIDTRSKTFMTHYPYGRIFRKQTQSTHFTNTVNYHTLSGSYLGQLPPKDEPEVFAPGIISTKNSEHSAPSFSPDGKEVIWSMWRLIEEMPATALEQVIMYMKEEDGIWTYPEIISFSGKFRDGGPQFSLDGQYIFFGSRRPVQTDTGTIYQGKSYYALRTATGWSSEKECKEIPREYSDKKIYQMLGTTPIVKVNDELYRLPEINENVEQLKNMGSIVWNNIDFSLDSIAIFSSPQGNGDIYLSHNNLDGSWGVHKPLGNNINTNRQERFVKLSPDRKYLFFTRHRGGDDHDIWWIDANVIKNVK